MSMKVMLINKNYKLGQCSTLSPMIISAEDKQGFILFEIISKVLPIVITACCYMLINKRIKPYLSKSRMLEANCSRMKWYPLSQVFLYSPLLINEVCRVWFGISSPFGDSIAITIFELAGLVNSTIYVFKRTKYSASSSRKMSLDSMSLYQSFGDESTGETFLV